jgi:hypothetical protein
VLGLLETSNALGRAYMKKRNSCHNLQMAFCKERKIFQKQKGTEILLDVSMEFGQQPSTGKAKKAYIYTFTFCHQNMTENHNINMKINHFK